MHMCMHAHVYAYTGADWLHIRRHTCTYVCLCRRASSSAAILRHVYTHVSLRVPVQAREFFRGAARMAEGKQAGIHLISANNMTRRLDVTLAIIEYQVHACTCGAYLWCIHQGTCDARHHRGPGADLRRILPLGE